MDLPSEKSRLGVFQRPTRMLLARLLVLLSSVNGGGAVGMDGEVLQFRRALMIFAVRSVVVTRGH
jgi:hypothetical protein